MSASAEATGSIDFKSTDGVLALVFMISLMLLCLLRALAGNVPWAVLLAVVAMMQAANVRMRWGGVYLRATGEGLEIIDQVLRYRLGTPLLRWRDIASQRYGGLFAAFHLRLADGEVRRIPVSRMFPGDIARLRRILADRVPPPSATT